MDWLDMTSEDASPMNDNQMSYIVLASSSRSNEGIVFKCCLINKRLGKTNLYLVLLTCRIQARPQPPRTT